jgi:MerR family copper efflux transcriptional regulator
MNIGEAERACGLPAKTIRYYEDVGLVTPERRANGYRTYQDLDLHKLRFLQRARGLGFSVEDCRALLALYDDKARASADVKSIAEAHLARIDQKLAELATLRGALTTLIDACHGDHRPDCPIIDDLAGT